MYHGQVVEAEFVTPATALFACINSPCCYSVDSSFGKTLNARKVHLLRASPEYFCFL